MDELTSAAWLDPSLITKKEMRFMDVNLDRALATETLCLDGSRQAQARGSVVEMQVDLDTDRFYKLLVSY